jgi:hypothetical protein
MPVSVYDLEWWQWLICALLCWCVSLALAALIDELGRKHIAITISFWLSIIAGAGCSFVGVMRTIKGAPSVEWWQWLICALMCWFASLAFAVLADKVDRNEHIAATISSWLGMIAGVDCATFGIIRFIERVRTS